ncbi:45912_t:CDS:2 [Gigaspora margarita]|uniref:45912_t:CDS:1 n=1 Tax=Gigaspora margarita TaxID=4874 RepID=A0ABN7WP69_GIGMA|nr:45912_t:CDS:2 [Gigaspora margarita]
MKIQNFHFNFPSPNANYIFPNLIINSKYNILSLSLNLPSPNEKNILSNLISSTSALYERRNYTINIKNHNFHFNPKLNYKNTSLFHYRSNNLSQFLNLPYPNENHFIILLYGDYSASEMENLFYSYMHLVNSTRLNKNRSNQVLMDKNFCIIEIEEIKDEKYKTTNIDQAESIKFAKNISEDDINNNKFFEIKKGIISSRNEIKSEDKDSDSETINNVRKAELNFANISSFSILNISPFESIEICEKNNLAYLYAPNKNTNDKNESDQDDNRISEIQKGIDIGKDKLKEYYDLNLLFNKIRKDILALQKDINNLENFHLREEFGEYYGVLMI